MDRFYHNRHPFPSFSSFWGFLYGSPLNSSVSLAISLIIAGIIRAFKVSYFISISPYNGVNKSIKEIDIKIHIHKQVLISVLYSQGG